MHWGSGGRFGHRYAEARREADRRASLASIAKFRYDDALRSLKPHLPFWLREKKRAGKLFLKSWLKFRAVLPDGAVDRLDRGFSIVTIDEVAWNKASWKRLHSRRPNRMEWTDSSRIPCIDSIGSLPFYRISMHDGRVFWPAFILQAGYEVDAMAVVDGELHMIGPIESDRIECIQYAGEFVPRGGRPWI